MFIFISLLSSIFTIFSFNLIHADGVVLEEGEKVVLVDTTYSNPLSFVMDDKPELVAVANHFPLEGVVSGIVYENPYTHGYSRSLGLPLPPGLEAFLFSELSAILSQDLSQPQLSKYKYGYIYDAVHILGTGSWSKQGGTPIELGNHSFTIKGIARATYTTNGNRLMTRVWGAIVESESITKALKDKGMGDKKTFYILIGHQDKALSPTW